MTKYLLDNCCFCVDLRVGCFVIGYINMISSAIGSILSIIAISAAGGLTNSVDPAMRAAGVALLAMSVVTLLVVGAYLVFAIVFLVGLHKHKPGCVKAYLVYSVVFLVTSFILLIVTLAIMAFDVGIIVTRIAGILFNIYIIMVVRSYYYKMLEGNGAGVAHYTS